MLCTDIVQSHKYVKANIACRGQFVGSFDASLDTGARGAIKTGLHYDPRALQHACNFH